MSTNPPSPRRALLDSPVGPTLVRMALPMVLGIITVMLFGLVDTFFLGLLGTEELAAISFTFPVSFIVMNLTMGLGIGTSTVLARLLGEGRHEQAARLTTDGLLLALLIVVLVTVAGLLSIEPLFTLLGAPQRIITHIRDYMELWYVGALFLVIPMVGNSAIRATGDTRTPSLIMVMAGLLNGLLDPLLIFGPGPFPALGMRGAAWATVIAWAVSFCSACWILYRRDRLITLHYPGVRAMLRSWQRVLHIGIPAALSNMLVPLASGVLTAMVARFGPGAVAAFGVGSRIEAFALVFVMALSAALPPFLGQNLGAGNSDRVRRAIGLSLRIAMGLQLALYVLLAAGGPWLGRIFSDDPEVIAGIALFLLILPASYGFQAMIILIAAALNSLRQPLEALGLNVIRQFLLYIPGAWLGGRLFGLTGLFIGAAAGASLAGILAWLRIRHHCRRLRQPS